MTQAQIIMRKKQFIKEEIDRMLPRQQSDLLWKQATARLDRLLRKYADIPKGEHFHTDSYIFPSAAIYLTAKKYLPQEQAYAIIEDAAIRNSSRAGKKIAAMMRLPFMRDIFIRVWDPLTHFAFGQSSGFQNRFYPKKKGEYRMDVLACPYCKYFTELHCFELTKIFCENDERCYGDLPGVIFARTGTLGKGADCCDFCLKKA